MVVVYMIVNLTQKKILGGVYHALKPAKQDLKEWRKIGSDNIVLTKTFK